MSMHWKGDGAGGGEEGGRGGRSFVSEQKLNLPVVAYCIHE